MSLFNHVQTFIENRQRDNKYVLTCQEVKSDSTDSTKKIAITHEVPMGEHIALGDSLYFLSGKNIAHMKLVMQPTGKKPVETDMFYVHEADIFVGHRDIAGIHYQLTLKLFETGLDEYLLQISYHNIDDLRNHQATHDGTIHPLP